MDAFQQFDTVLFYAVNHGLSNSFFDTIMPVLTSTAVWRPIYAAAILWLLIFGKAEGRWCALGLVVAVALLDPLSTHLLKEPIGRLRPYDVLPDAHQLVGSGAGSFPSNHALNNAAAAVIASSFYPRLRWVFWSLVFLIAFSRVYVGVHWVSDVLGGAAIGTIAGVGILWLLRKIINLVHRRRGVRSTQPPPA